MNNYHLRLNLPVPLTFPSYTVPDMKRHFHTRFHKTDMNEDFKQWIHSKGLAITAGEFFYTAPQCTLEPHSDTPEITDVVKLNWMVGGEGSTMDWYELKPGAVFQTNTTPIQTQYSYAPKIDLEHVHSATVGSPSLVNVGRIHGVQNGMQPRYVACVILHWPGTSKRLVWSEAIKIFEKYVV